MIFFRSIRDMIRFNFSKTPLRHHIICYVADCGGSDISPFLGRSYWKAAGNMIGAGR